MKIRGATALLACIAMAGCDLTTEPGQLGTFSGGVTGEVTATMNGTSLFGSTVGEFVLSMTDPTDGQAVHVARFSTRPGTGTYDIEHYDTETGGFIAAYARQGQPGVTLRSVTGQLTITGSSPTRLQGTMTFEGVGHFTENPATEVHATVSVEFDSRCIRTGGADCL